MSAKENQIEQQRKTIWELEAESKSKAGKTLKKAKEMEKEKISTGDYEYVQIDEKTQVLRKVR